MLSNVKKKQLLLDYFNARLYVASESKECDKKDCLENITFEDSYQLLDSIHDNIPAAQINSLFYDSYDDLDRRYDFNQNQTQQMGLIMAITRLYMGYHIRESNQTKKQALKSSLLCCLIVVTIPFFPLIYFYFTNKYKQRQTFHTLKVDTAIVSRHPKNNSESYYKYMRLMQDKPVVDKPCIYSGHKKNEKSALFNFRIGNGNEIEKKYLPENVDRYRWTRYYGYDLKAGQTTSFANDNQKQVDFKCTLFNRSGQLRKYAFDGTFGAGKNGGCFWGGPLLLTGTKNQIDKARKTFNEVERSMKENKNVIGCADPRIF